MQYPACTGYVRSLWAVSSCDLKGVKADQGTVPDSHTNYWYLSTPEKDRRLSWLHVATRNLKKSIFHLQAHLAKVSESLSWVEVLLMDEMHIKAYLVYDKFSGELLIGTAVDDTSKMDPVWYSHSSTCGESSRALVGSTVALAAEVALHGSKDSTGSRGSRVRTNHLQQR